ncbi:MAG: tRNA epoxyqueuosine(34) reductase QueG [Acidobacteria bacterium]|nr:MAG: tRNA epoxyqueuosine(34) reductase QueG [Acidobacteriota bacterium]
MTFKTPSQISAFIKQAAHDAGFELAGIASVRRHPELEHFEPWVAAGYAGEMKYMKARDETGNLKRASLDSAVPWARSVIVCAINYNTAQPYSTAFNHPGHGWISRYAWSMEDYHEAVMRRLREVESRLRQESARLQEELQTRCYVDTGPLVERVYAKYAGIGWIGKNTCILNQKLGSWLFLGVILTSIELEPDLPAPDRCGTCTRCIDACPTDAFVGPYQLDSNRCISYLTIEKRGEIPEDLRAGMGRHVFGCDICQDVCPWNRKAPTTAAPEFYPREELINPAIDWLAGMSADEFRNVFRRSPVRRAKHEGLRRNAIIAIGNSGDRRFLPLLERVLNDPDPVISEHANWAKDRLSAETEGLGGPA